MTSALDEPGSDIVNPTIPEWVSGHLSDGLADELDRCAWLIRSPDGVMTPGTLHGMTATRLSFARTLIRRMAGRRWKIELRECDIAPDSTGYMAYDIRAENLHLSFGVFVYPPFPPGTQRLFRDTTTEFLGILLDGPVDNERFLREKQQFDTDVWRGRTDPSVYGWTIASRGTRTFDEVVDALTAGRQPDPGFLDANGGYILRNGGYYGNGRMGTRAWASYAHADTPFEMPYHIDLFSVYMWRLVSFDLAEATARARSPHAVAIDPAIKRHVGIGNSSGLGTVAALVRWPGRLSSFILPRELAFAYVKGRPGPLEPAKVSAMASLLANAATAYEKAQRAADELLEPREMVAEALRRIRDLLPGVTNAATASSGGAGRADGARDLPWLRLTEAAREFDSVEAVEVLHSLLLELYPEVDELSEITAVAIRHHKPLDPSMTLGDLRRAVEEHFAWAVFDDLVSPGHREFFWYRSEENGENRRGERSVDVGVERETFIDVAGAVRRLYDFTRALPPGSSVGRFLVEEPEHTLAVSRVQLAIEAPFSEIRARICGTDFLASNGIRCFLSLLGIELSTPHSGRWVRGLFFRGAPLPEDLADGIVEEGGIGAAGAAASVAEGSTGLAGAGTLESSVSR